ncbi:potassium/proton antiporter [Pseudonocardiaceae bacterium YIM PH 21723]|nr:potassium/proton antiporter [Pseudonocardiaceae bacterium YIM PH 21723]
MTDLAEVLGIGAGVLLIAVLAVRFSVRLGTPTLLVYLGIGLALGEAGVGIDFDDSHLTEALGLAALVLILIEGGLTTRWRAVKPALPLGVALATISVVASIAVAGTALHYLLGLDWRTALLWGAVLSSTDAAAVFSVLRGVPVFRRIAGALELESGLNDPAVFLAVVLLASPDPIRWTTPLVAGYELLAGATLGLLLGRIGVFLLRRAALPATGLYPLATVAVCVLAFSAGQLAHASGLLATYLAALILGNSQLPHRGDTVSFAEGLGWLAQIGLFVLLGLYASPERLPAVVVPALIAAAVITFLARPFSVWLASTSLWPLGRRIPWREQVFLSWSGLRGAVPIVLALIPLTLGREGAETLVDVVFVLVVVLTAVQGTTLPWLARKLGLTEETGQRELEVDAAPLDELDATLLQVTLPPDSKLHNVDLMELRLPAGSTVSLVVRAGEAFTPNRETRLQRGDQLLVVCTDAVSSAVRKRLHDVDRHGRLAGWFKK